ncbi:MAG TPA: DUF4388 domain-containing protein [Vicinamibacterales bacterium]|nr:DUF4388 domain-containing protein [Vicinamibacterales bacterium]
MVEGDLLDLSLPNLMNALTTEGSTVAVKVQRGVDHGAVYFHEGVLVHAHTGESTGNDAVYELLSWVDGRFRLARDPEHRPRTITQRAADFLSGSPDQPDPFGHVTRATAEPQAATPDERLLTELLTLLTRLEQDRVRLSDGGVNGGAVAALLVTTAVVNSLVAFVTAKCGDPDVRPSRVLPRLADSQPYTQLLGEENDRISVATVAGVLKTWDSSKEDRQSLFRDLCRALLDVLSVYCSTVSTFFHGSREREEWKATSDVFIDGLWTAVQQIEA